jgi:hypothetical protein
MKTEYLIQVFTSHEDVYLHADGKSFTGNVGYAMKCDNENKALQAISKAPEGSYVIVPVHLNYGKS